jgi:thioredoxin 1
MGTVAVTDQSFEADVLKSGKPVLVDFWAEWCGPCKQIAPALEQIAAELGEHVTVVKLNIEDCPETPGRYGVRGIPTMMLFNDRHEGRRHAQAEDRRLAVRVRRRLSQ